MNGLSLVCLYLMCDTSEPLKKNALSHTSHRKLRFPECTTRCAFKPSLDANDLLQTSQTSILVPDSFECNNFLCLFKYDFEGKNLEQMSHPNGRSSVCVRMCRTKVVFRSNDLGHSRHLCGFSRPECLAWKCFRRAPDSMYALPHSSQT